MVAEILAPRKPHTGIHGLGEAAAVALRPEYYAPCGTVTEHSLSAQGARAHPRAHSLRLNPSQPRNWMHPTAPGRPVGRDHGYRRR